jgi:uncharacterized SAM-binding protein YcdF (DUF218 family)
VTTAAAEPVTPEGPPHHPRRREPSAGGPGAPSGPLRWALRLCRGLLVVVLLAVVAIVASAGRIWWVARHDDRPTSDAIVVLGASQFNGRPSSVLEARLDHALDLYKARVAPVIVTVGGSRPGDRFTEGTAGRRWLIDHGVGAGDAVAVGTGADTLGSLRAVADLSAARGWHSVVLVTDPWHSLRARTMARDLGLEAATSPTRQGPAVRTRATEVRYISRETLGYLYYRIFHRSSGLGPPAF